MHLQHHSLCRKFYIPEQSGKEIRFRMDDLRGVSYHNACLHTVELIPFDRVLEVDVGIICACAPVFTAFFDPDTPRSFGRAMKKLFSQ